MNKHTWGWRRASLCLALQLVCAAGCVGRTDQPRKDEVETTARALAVASGFIDETFVSGLDRPTAMEFAPDGRLFVTQQGGRLRVVKGGQLLATPFVALSVDSNGERGLLGITFDPGFSSNGFLYVYYTTPSGGVHNRLSRFTASGDVAVAGSEVVLSEFDALSSATNHNGGAVHLGTDGKLYVAVGDNANGNNSQTLNNRLGKVHRYNLDGSIPTDNPFFTSTTGANRSIWALGLRNPYTFAIQPGTGRIFINDVGENTFEEINGGSAAANYGWPHAEGPNNNGPGDTRPLYSYAHSSGGCSIAGGTFYNPATAQFPGAFIGHYFFADYCAGWIKRLDPSTNQAFDFASGGSSLVDLKVGSDGALYYLDRDRGVGRIRGASNQPPRIDGQPASQTVAVGQSATFSVSASGTAPLSYQWQRNAADIAGANNASYTLAGAAAGDSGAQFRVVVSNVAGSATSNAATLTVTSNRPPVATITAPVAGARYAAGTTITYAGTGSDPEDGSLGGAAFTWEVVFHHDSHTHPFIAPQTGAQGGSFVIPDRGETATNVFYRLHLTVKDAGGLTNHTSVDLLPRTANVTLQTNPPGLQVTLDGQPLVSPATVNSVVGMVRTLGVVSPQTLGGTSYVFASWSDGGAATHTVSTPATDQSYLATFTPAGPSSGGLSGDYFDNRDLTGLRFTRVDPTVDFDWGTGTPDARLGPDTFSVRWTGTVTPTTSETYTFTTRADDGVRLWVNDRLLIDNWVDQSATERSATLALTAGQAYPVRLEYYENGVDATMRLLWSSPSVPKQVIPQARLSPAAAPPPAGFPIKINFQLAGAPIPAGYLADTGATFGPRGGQSYGWNVSHTDLTRDRNDNPDQRLDTLCHFHSGGVWEIALPNGTYNVLVSIGDPSADSTHTLNVEGVNYWSAVALGSGQFRSATKTVTVSDGRLTVDQGDAGEKATRINYLEITR
jgi:glucose/arabinose dehydrogenase